MRSLSVSFVLRLVLIVAALHISLCSARAQANAVMTRSALQSRADRAAWADTASARPVALSISGGISLGSYMAGVNWAVAETFRQADNNSAFRREFLFPRHRISAIAGASAGSINALVWVAEACGPVDTVARPPEESLFWKIWVGMGLQTLLPDTLGAVRDTALFERTGLRVSIYDSIRAALRRGNPRCDDLPVALALTHLRPERVSGRGIEAVTQRFAAAFQAHVVSGQPTSPGGTDTTAKHLVFLPLVRNDEGRVRPLCPAICRKPIGSTEIADSILFGAVEASSAFPLAFSPKRLRVLNPKADSGTVEMVMDGGVFDNNPVGLATWLYPRTAAGTSDSLLVVYINPMQLRGTLSAVRQQRARLRDAPGGLSSVLQLARGAVPSARQHDLETWVRENQQNVRLISLSTERSYPLVSEHLGAFAGFLARPFREYDFYVGIYDGLRALAAAYPCANQRDTTATEVCVTRIQSRWMSQWLNLGKTAPVVLGSLLEQDGGERIVSVAQSREDSTRAILMSALVQAQTGQFSEERPECKRRASIGGRLLCSDGMSAMLDSLKANNAVQQELRFWRHTVREDSQFRGEMIELDRWVNHHDQAITELIDAVLYRLRYVEGAVKRSEVTDKVKTNRETAVEALGMVYFSGPLRRRYGFSFGSSSVPGQAGPRLLRYGPRTWDLLPYSVGITMGASGYEATWRPMIHVSDRWALGIPLIPFHRSSYTASPHNYWGHGGSLVFKGCPIPRVNCDLLVSEATVSRLWFHPWGESIQRGEVSATELSTTVLAGKLQLAFRVPSARDRLHGGNRNAFMVSMTDLPGLVYWTSRLVH